MAPVTRNNAKPSDRQEQETLWTKRQTLPAKTYRNQVFEFLKHHYSKISVSCIRQTLKHHGHSFTASYRTLDRINRLTQEDVPPRQLEDRIRREFPFLSPTSSIVIQRRRSSPHPMLSNQELLDEIDGVDELNQKENRKENRKGASVCVAEGMVRENDRGPFVPVPPPVAASIPSVTSLSSPFSSPTAAFKTPAKKPDEMEVECQCCYGDFPFEIMVHCNNGHLFCSACLRSHVSEELFGNNRDSFKCMSMDGCTEGFEDMMLDKALTPRIRKKTGEHIYRAEIAKLQLDDLWSCPKCTYLLIVDNDTKVVKCPDCSLISCRLCGEEPHKNQSCEEAKAEREKSNVREKMANAMTEAVVRQCPGCRCKIMKSTGCNKMTCSNHNCQTKFCYVCRKKIRDYEHFCRAPHCNHSSCGKCVLFSNTEEDDRRARREAAASMESEGITASDVGLASPDMKAGAQIKKNHQNQPPALLQLNINAHQQPRDNLADQYQALHGDEVPAGGACIVM